MKKKYIFIHEIADKNNFMPFSLQQSQCYRIADYRHPSTELLSSVWRSMLLEPHISIHSATYYPPPLHARDIDGRTPADSRGELTVTSAASCRLTVGQTVGLSVFGRRKDLSWRECSVRWRKDRFSNRCQTSWLGPVWFYRFTGSWTQTLLLLPVDTSGLPTLPANWIHTNVFFKPSGV